MKSSASMYESLGSQFPRTTMWIQSVPDAFDSLRLVMTFLTNLGVTEILCNVILALEGRASIEVPEWLR